MFGGNGGNGGDNGQGESDIKPLKGSYRKYLCPVCGLIARTTKDANIACYDCNELMVKGA